MHVFAERNYGRELDVGLLVEEAALVGWLVDRVSLDGGRQNAARSVERVEELKGAIKTIRAETQKEDRATLTALKDLTALANGATKLLDGPDEAVKGVLLERLPRFYYFSDCSNLRGRLDLTNLLAKEPTAMTTREDGTLTAQARWCGGRGIHGRRFRVPGRGA